MFGRCLCNCCRRRYDGDSVAAASIDTERRPRQISPQKGKTMWAVQKGLRCVWRLTCGEREALIWFVSWYCMIYGAGVWRGGGGVDLALFGLTGTLCDVRFCMLGRRSSTVLIRPCRSNQIVCSCHDGVIVNFCGWSGMTGINYGLHRGRERERKEPK